MSSGVMVLGRPRRFEPGCFFARGAGFDAGDFSGAVGPPRSAARLHGLQ